MPRRRHQMCPLYIVHCDLEKGRACATASDCEPHRPDSYRRARLLKASDSFAFRCTAASCDIWSIPSSVSMRNSRPRCGPTRGISPSVIASMRPMMMVFTAPPFRLLDCDARVVSTSVPFDFVKEPTTARVINTRAVTRDHVRPRRCSSLRRAREINRRKSGPRGEQRSRSIRRRSMISPSAIPA
jgi:hypothetical protein